MFKHIFIISFNIVFFISGLALGQEPKSGTICTGETKDSSECNKNIEPEKKEYIADTEESCKAILKNKRQRYRLYKSAKKKQIEEAKSIELTNDEDQDEQENVAEEQGAVPAPVTTVATSELEDEFVKTPQEKACEEKRISNRMYKGITKLFTKSEKTSDPDVTDKVKTEVDENIEQLNSKIDNFKQEKDKILAFLEKVRTTQDLPNFDLSKESYTRLYVLDAKNAIIDFNKKDFQSVERIQTKKLSQLNDNFNDCITGYKTATQACDASKSELGVKAKTKMQNFAEKGLEQISTEKSLGLLGVAAIGAKDLLNKAKIKCGHYISVSALSCQQARKNVVAMQKKMDDMSQSEVNFFGNLEQHTANLNSDYTANCTNTSSDQARCTRLQSFIQKLTKLTTDYNSASSEIYNKSSKDNLNKVLSEILALIDKQQQSIAALEGPHAEHSKLADALGSAAKDALKAKAQITGQNLAAANNGSVVNAQMNVCSDPSSLQCKCYQNANAEGCPGAVVNNFVKSLNPGGGNQMAAISTGGIQKPNLDLGKTVGGTNDGSSSGSTATLGGNNNSGIDSKTTGFQAAVAGSAGGGGGGTGSANTDKNQKVDPAAEASNMGSNYKFNGSGYSRGSAFGGKAQLSGQKYSDMQKKLERQIASQQYKSEVSDSSGTSNWDKVKNRYIQMKSSFVGQ